MGQHHHPVIEHKLKTVIVNVIFYPVQFNDTEWDAATNAVIYMVLVSSQADFSNEELAGVTTKTQKELGDYGVGQQKWVRIVPLGREFPGTKSAPASIIVR